MLFILEDICCGWHHSQGISSRNWKPDLHALLEYSD
jgi:hypothetical protein